MRFSERTAWDREENNYAAALALARRSRSLLDLTVSNPTRCQFHSSKAVDLASLADSRTLGYSPEPFGLLAARQAVGIYYRDHGAVVAPADICLTTSTSEAYGFLFQLLCDPGDEVLVARPSYPLFDLLARLHDVHLREYPLRYDPSAAAAYAPAQSSPDHGAWSIDLAALRQQITARTRALIVVHPNNPTGDFATEAERRELEQICAEAHLALLVDEVFVDYTRPGTKASSFTAEAPGAALRFVLSGLSKVCALPQMKLSWIVVQGPDELVAEARDRLEIIADTYLSLNAPVQYALPGWLAERHALQTEIRKRLVANLKLLDERLRGSNGDRLAFEGGWTTVLRVPRHVEGTEFALACLEKGVVVQPGELYGLPPGRAVLSLLTPPEVWVEGLSRLPL